MLNQDQVQLASSAVREMRVALSNYFLYAAGNDMIQKSVVRLAGAMDLLFAELSSVSLGESEGQLLVEGTALNDRMTGSTNMILDLYLTHKIHSITFLKGVRAEEIKTLFELLKPKSLPTGVSLAQALVQKPLEHIRLNEKIYVSLEEGEKVVSADVLPAGEENLQEALEALQYFLQIFSRVRPDSNKREVARKMIDNMGSWLTAGIPVWAPSTASPTAGQAAQGSASGGGEVQSLLEIMNGFLSLKKTIEVIDQPAQLKNAKVGMDDLLKKLVLLGENQGVDWKDSGVPGAGGEQGNLFDVDSVLTDLRSGQSKLLWDEAYEQQVGERLGLLQGPEEAETFESLWESLWAKIFSGDEAAEGLALRHLNRLQWNAVPRHLQLEGLRNLRKFLLSPRFPASYPIGLTLAQNWLPLETVATNWEEFLETVKVLKESAEKTPPIFEKQNLAAQVALETVFCEPVLDNLCARYMKSEKDRPAVLRLFTILGALTGPVVVEKAFRAMAGSPEWERWVDLLTALETGGVAIYEPWLKEKEGAKKLDLFLEIFKRAPLPAHLADYLEKNWPSFTPEIHFQILEIVELRKRTDFRPLLLRLLAAPENPLAIRALKALGKAGLHGDSRSMITAFKKFPPHGKDRDKFWAALCHALGELADPLAIDSLMEWGDKYKFLENKKERGLEVRVAALEALGHFRSNSVKTFLAGLHMEGDKEAEKTVEQSLKSVEEKLAQPQGS